MPTIHNRYVNRLFKTIGFYQKDDVIKVVKDIVEEARRSPSSMNPMDVLNNIVETPYDYSLLVKYSLNNEVLRTDHDAIIREAVRNGWDIKPKWLRKCPTCGTEFQTVKETCPECDVETIEPDAEQKKVLEAFIDDPNRDDEMDAILKSLLRYALAVDDMWLSVSYANGEEGRPLAIYVEDSRYMRVATDDKHGTLGNSEYFCPICTKDEPTHVFSKDEHCPKHPTQKLLETAYVYKDGEVKARYARDEIIHMRVDPWLPGHYGNSKVISCLRILLSIVAMDKFNFDTYTTGKLAQIIILHGLDQKQVNELVDEAKNQTKKTEDQDTQVIANKLRTLFIGTKEGATKVDSMPPSEKMQSVDWWKLWREIVGSVYGVTPIFSGVVESGKTGNNPRMQIDVQNNTTEMYQKSIEDPFNNALLPKLGVTDWLFAFNPVEEKDEMQEITVLRAKVDAVITATNAGMNAELTDEGEVRISGKPKKPEPVLDPSKYLNPEEKPDEGEEPPAAGKHPFKVEEVFSQEKGERSKLKRGRSYIVTELESSEGSSSGPSG